MLYIKSVATSHMRLFKDKLLIKIKQDLKFSSSNPMWLLATVLASIKTERFHGCWDAPPGSVALEQWLVHAFLLSILQLLHLRRLCQLCEGSWLPHAHSSCSWLFHFYAFLCHQHFPFPFLSLRSRHSFPVNFTNLTWWQLKFKVPVNALLFFVTIYLSWPLCFLLMTLVMS